MKKRIASFLGCGLILLISIVVMPLKAYASNGATLFQFRSYMPGEGNCEGVAWSAGKSLGEQAYASWDARKGMMWVGIGSKVYQSTFQRTEANRIKVVEADFGDVHVVISIPQQATYDAGAYPVGTLELLSNSSNKSYGRIDVSVGEAC